MRLNAAACHAIVTLVDLTRYVDLYCERTGPALWGEPWNAVTNLAFFAAAAFGWREARRAAADGRTAWDLRLLAVLAALVGAGSLAFHTFAQVWAGWADGLANLAFIYAWLARYLARAAGLGTAGIAVGLAGYALLEFAAGRLVPPPALNGSGRYLTALAALAVLALHARSRFPSAAAWLGTGAALFAVSITMRTLDRDVCAAFPVGTHFLWHLLNGCVLAAAIGGLARADRRSEPAVRGHANA